MLYEILLKNPQTIAWNISPSYIFTTHEFSEATPICAYNSSTTDTSMSVSMSGGDMTIPCSNDKNVTVISRIVDDNSAIKAIKVEYCGFTGYVRENSLQTNQLDWSEENTTKSNVGSTNPSSTGDDGEGTESTDPTDPITPETPAAAEDPLCITPSMIELLVTQILGKVNERIAARIVNVISDTSDDKHVPSALAVFNFLRTVTPGMSCQTVVGSMDSVTEPNGRIIYLQKDDEGDQTWTMYLWVDDAWVSIGDTSIDLVNYWSKSEIDIAELRDKILDANGLKYVTDGLNLANVLRNDDASKAIVLEWIGSTSVDNIGEEGMAAIIEAVLAETDKLYVKKDELPETLKEYVKKDELPAQPAVITEPQITAAVNAAFAATEPTL